MLPSNDVVIMPKAVPPGSFNAVVATYFYPSMHLLLLIKVLVIDKQKNMDA